MALKTWDSKGWCTALSDTTTVTVADTDVGAGEVYKPMFVYLAQTGRAVPVRTHLAGRHLLLSHEEARSLVEWLLESQLIELDLKRQAVLIGADYRADEQRTVSTTNQKAQRKQARRKPGRKGTR